MAAGAGAGVDVGDVVRQSGLSQLESGGGDEFDRAPGESLGERVEALLGYVHVQVFRAVVGGCR
jgi:hypothetical protein